jgi:hypothetical protein
VMLATEARLTASQLGLSFNEQRRRSNSRIFRGSCPAQAGSKKLPPAKGFYSRHDLTAARRRRFRVESDLSVLVRGLSCVSNTMKQKENES